MNSYTPDTWVVLEFNTPTMATPLRKVFAGWYGGYTGGDSWKLNSGITKTRKSDEYWEFDGYSGSVYRCHPNNYKMSGLMYNVLGNWLTQTAVQIRILSLDEIVES